MGNRPRAKRKHPTSDDCLIDDAMARVLRLVQALEDLWTENMNRDLTGGEREWLRRMADESTHDSRV